MRFIILMALCIACGREGPDVDPALQPILDRYLALAPSEGRLDDLTALEFGEPGSGAAGICKRNDIRIGGKMMRAERKVIIRRGETRPLFEAAVMHELAHCLHDKGHSDDPESLMATSLYPSDPYWEEHLDEKVRALFQ